MHELVSPAVICITFYRIWLRTACAQMEHLGDNYKCNGLGPVF